MLPLPRTKRPSSCSQMIPSAARSLGIALLGAGRTSEAIERFEAVLRVDPRDARAHNNLGYAYSKVGRMEMAVEHFEAAVRLEPTPRRQMPTTPWPWRE